MEDCLTHPSDLVKQNHYLRSGSQVAANYFPVEQVSGPLLLSSLQCDHLCQVGLN